MASSVLAGDRRWASARKGMTVLGKVPKPINLPSQRSENHGLDPNVEIVPKGTLTWGSKSSSTTPNAWASSTLLSPKADGSTGSPSHPSGRPSSGGSGTRPSTACSERSQDASPNAWGPNSRPSSSSGLLPSSQAHLVTNRPRSAETRPGSSQLSRFAENLGESQVVWGPNRTAERLGVSSSKVDPFMLNSGDFPTLGTEKSSTTNLQRGHSSHGRPVSSSGADATTKEILDTHARDENVDTNMEHGNVNVLKADKNLYSGSDAPSKPKWQNEPSKAQPYTNLNMPPHQMDSWHGPPVHPPDGSWYRGPPGGQYRPPGPPGSYPVDPFVYYPRQFPPNSETVVRPVPGQSGYNPTNGDPYRPQVPGSSFIIPSHPVIPARPGVFQSPVAYDGYYPQVAFMGPATRPGFYNQYLNQNVNANRGMQARPSVHDMQVDKEHMVSERAHSLHQGQYKVLLKQHDGSNAVHSQERTGQSSCPPQLYKESETSKLESKQHPVSEKSESSVKMVPDHKVLSHHVGQESNLSHPSTTPSQESVRKTSDGILSSKPEVSSATLGQQHYPVARKNATLIEKIEGLNNKARNAENQNDTRSYGHEKFKQTKYLNAKHDNLANSSGTGPSEIVPTKSSGNVVISDVRPVTINKNRKFSNDAMVSGYPESRITEKVLTDNLRHGEIGHSSSQKKIHAGGSRIDHHVKSKSESHTQDGLAKDSSRKETSPTNTGVINDNLTRGSRPDFHSSKEAISKDSGRESSPPDSVDYETQRAKLREIAANRAKQLQREEEERTREQKAKALAKLEELNRRSASQGLKPKHDASLPTDNKSHQEDSQTVTAVKIGTVEIGALGGVTSEKSYGSLQASESKLKNPEVPSSLPQTTPSAASETVPQEPASLPAEESNIAEGTAPRSNIHSHDRSGSRNKQVGYKRRQKVPQEKNLSDKLISTDNAESPKNVSEFSADKGSNDKSVAAMDVAAKPVEVSTLATNSEKLAQTEDSSMHQKRKNNRNLRNKVKMDETPVLSTVPPLLQSTKDHEDCPSESSKTHSLVSEVVSTGSFAETSESQGSNDITTASSEPDLSKESQESHGRVNSQWKSQPSRRPRVQQVRSTDKFHGSETVVWAPVKVPNKIEQSDESSQTSAGEVNAHATRRNEQDVQVSTKTKRAEIERYVPKPVSKELQQQENLQQSSSSLNPSLSTEVPEKSKTDSKVSGVTSHEGPSDVKSESVVENEIIEDSRSRRQGKTHTSWRQRHSSHSSSNFPNANKDPVVSDVIKPSSRISDRHFPGKLDNVPDEHMPRDGLESSKSLLPTESAAVPEVRDHGIPNRQRRQNIKFQKPTGSTYVAAQVSDSSDKITANLDLNETDIQTSVRNESKNPSGESTRTHWKPKSHPYSHGERQGSNVGEGNRASYHVGGSGKEFSSQGSQYNSVHNLSSRSSAPQKDGAKQNSGADNQEAKPDNTPSDVVAKGHPQNCKQEISSNVELAPVTVETKQEHQTSHTMHRHGQNVGQFNRGHESNHRNKDLGHNSRKQYGQGDKRKNHAHYEYQPIGAYNKPDDLVEAKSNINQNATEVQHDHGQRFREKGHNQTRRNGNFFRRGGAAVAHVGDSQNSGE